MSSRKARLSFVKKKDLYEVLTILADSTQCRGGEVDFIVASHTPDPALYKVSDGRVCFGGDRYWLGVPEAVSLLDRMMADGPKGQGSGFVTAEEAEFRRAFTNLVREHAPPGVGGFVFHCLGSSRGYCYQNHAGTLCGAYTTYDPVFSSSFPSYKKSH